MKGATVYHNVDLGTEISLSLPARKLLTEARVKNFIDTLAKWMNLFGASHAIVGKCGCGLEIHVHSDLFGKNVVRIEP